MPTPTETLRKIFRDIANAIRGKDGTAEATDKIHPEDYATRIGAIQTGPDTSDATATASDISEGKVAYGADGRIEGTLQERTSINVTGVAPSSMQSDGLHISASIPEASTGIVRSGAKINVTSPASYFGTATAGDVLSGKTFTSSTGLKVSGTLVPKTGTDVSDATASRSDIMSGKTAYIASGKVTGSMPTAGAISGQLGSTSGANWSSSDPNRGSGVVSITGVYQSAGHTAGFSNGTLRVTVPASRLLKGRTVTPTTTTQTIAQAEDIAYGAIKVAGDANLKGSNIKKGVSIFGVTGTMTAGTDTSDATATASDISEGKVAYGPSGKVTGNVIEIDNGSNTSINGTQVQFLYGDVFCTGVFNTSLLMRSGSMINVLFDPSDFGNATAADVAAGKTFTSSAGLKVTGTGTMASRVSVKITNNSSNPVMVYTQNTNPGEDSLWTQFINPSNTITVSANVRNFIIVGSNSDVTLINYGSWNGVQLSNGISRTDIYIYILYGYSNYNVTIVDY